MGKIANIRASLPKIVLAKLPTNLEVRPVCISIVGRFLQRTETGLADNVYRDSRLQE